VVSCGFRLFEFGSEEIPKPRVVGAKSGYLFLQRSLKEKSSFYGDLFITLQSIVCPIADKWLMGAMIIIG